MPRKKTKQPGNTKKAVPGSYYGLRRRVSDITGVSPQTVTAILQSELQGALPHPGQGFSEETRARVLKAVERVKRQIEKEWHRK